MRVAIIASGKGYQEAAAWAAPTFLAHMHRPNQVVVLLPEQELAGALLLEHAQHFGFSIGHFPFKKVSDRKFTSQLKCQGFLFAVSQLADGELLFLVDADTHCAKPLVISPEVEDAILSGKIGLVPDITDRHCKITDRPWYLGPEERTIYVNSGVVLASRSSIPMFETFVELSQLPQFLGGPFNDQKVINFALGRYFRDKLIVLDKAYNGMRAYRSSSTIIGHCPGLAGRLGEEPRAAEHQALCANILRSVKTGTDTDSTTQTKTQEASIRTADRMSGNQ